VLVGTEMHDAHMLSCGSACTSRASSCIAHGHAQRPCIQHSNGRALLMGIIAVVVVVVVDVVVVVFVVFVVVVVVVPWPVLSFLGSC
jgi:hypothetical protein